MTMVARRTVCKLQRAVLVSVTANSVATTAGARAEISLAGTELPRPGS